MRETVEIVRLAFAGERVAYEGRFHQLPLPGGEGKALRLSQPANESIPIYLATLGPRALEYTGEAADGWLGTSFTPDHAGAHLDYIRRGASGAGRDAGDIDIQAGGMVAFGDPAQFVPALKRGLAFTLGAMGSAKTNFYNEAYRRGGWEDVARESQSLWVTGRRDDAVAVIPDAMALASNLIGDAGAVAERMRQYRDAGVTTLRLQPAGADLGERLATLGQAMDLLGNLED